MQRFRPLFIALAVVPVILIAALIYRYGVNVPYFDEWDDTVTLHLHYLKGDLSLGLFFDWANEHRPALPRLILLASEVVTHGNRRVEMFISLLAVCITSLNLYMLARKTIPTYALPLSAIANWFLFSTVQYENWFWGLQLLMFLPLTLFTSAALVTYGNWSFGGKVACSIVLWILSTLCFISGFFFWPMLLILQLVVAPSPRARMTAAIVWVLALAMTAGLYFANTVPAPVPARPELILLYPQTAFAFFSSFFASPLRLRGMTWYQLWSIGITVCVIASIPLFRLVRDRSRLREILPWAGILVFALISGVAATASRLAMGLPQSQVSRYTTFSVLVPIAAMFLWAITLQRWPIIVRRGIVVLGIAVLALHLTASFQRIRDLRIVSASRSDAREALLRINIDDQDPRLAELFPDRKRLKLLANEYAKRGMLPPLETQPAPR